MKSLIRTAIIPLLFAGLTLLMQSCVLDSYPHEECSATADGEQAVLVLRVKAIGQTRAGDSNELIHTLRIIIFDGEGKVERIRSFRLTGAGSDSCTPLAIPVTAGRKSIYIIANEESVEYETSGGTAGSLADYLNTIAEGAEGVRTELSDMTFIPDYTKDIPMTSSYDDVELVPGNNENIFHVVRVATRFDVSIENKREEAVILNTFGVSSVADRSYLFPRLADDAGIITVQGKKPFVFDSASVLHWAEWLALTSEESQKKPDAPQADVRGWIMEYSVPASALHSPASWNVAGREIAVGGKITLPVRYVPESRLVSAGIEPFHADAAGLEQQYNLEITLTSGGEEHTFTLALPNLRALFRNTHVNIDVTLDELDVIWRIYVRPWNSITHPQIII